MTKRFGLFAVLVSVAVAVGVARLTYLPPPPVLAQPGNPIIIPQASLPATCTNGNLPTWLTPTAFYVCLGGVPTALANGSAAGVSSITGDGTIISNSGSTGAVTLTLANTVTGTGGVVLTNSPTLTGTPTLPTGTIATTQTATDNSTKIATTAFVNSVVGGAPFVQDAPISAATGYATVVNKIRGQAFENNSPVSVANICYIVSVADNTSNLYDFGAMTNTPGASGTVVLHTGAIAGTTATPTTGQHCIAVTGGPITLEAGSYFAAVTTNCSTSCATFNGTQQWWVINVAGGGFGTTSGGALTTTTMPSAGAGVTSTGNGNSFWLTFSQY